MLGKKKKKTPFEESLKAEKKKHRALGNCSNNSTEESGSDCLLKQLKRKFCKLVVTDDDSNCPFKKKPKQEEPIVDEINSPEIEKDEQASRLGFILIDDVDDEYPMEHFNDQITDNLLTKRITVRDSLFPKNNYFEPTPSRWLQCSEDAARAIVPYVEAQQIILNTTNNNNNGESKDDMVPDNVPSNDLLFDSYNYTQIPFQQHQEEYELFHDNNDRYQIDDIGNVEEIPDDEADMGMDVI